MVGAADGFSNPGLGWQLAGEVGEVRSGGW